MRSDAGKWLANRCGIGHIDAWRPARGAKDNEMRWW